MVCSLPLQPHPESCPLCFASSVPAVLSLGSSDMLYFPLPQTLHVLFVLYHLLPSSLFLFVHTSPLSLLFPGSLFRLSDCVIPSTRISGCQQSFNLTFFLSNPLVNVCLSHYCVSSMFLGLCLLLLSVVS